MSATRTQRPRWSLSDMVIVNGTRWVIRAMNQRTGAVYLVAANTTNHAMSWTTTLDKLPRKASA